jgi:hypothetical protein
LVEKFTKKGKPALNIKDIKQFFKVFVNCVVVNPEFDSQNKEKLESPKIKFEVKQNDFKKILKWSVIGDIEDMLKAKEMVVLKKSEKKKKGYVKIDGYDPANNAGGKNSSECGLILCEGLSAKTYAVAGIDKGVYGKSGRNWWGIWMEIPAPSPVLGSAPLPPRCSILLSMYNAPLMVSCVGSLVRSTTAPIPQESCSNSCRYNPCSIFISLIGLKTKKY